MPLYEHIVYVAGNEVARIDLPIPVEDRDKVTILRSPLPRSLAIAGSAQSPETNETLRAYHRVEQRMGNTSEFYHRIGHSPETVKRTWAHTDKAND